MQVWSPYGHNRNLAGATQPLPRLPSHLVSNSAFIKANVLIGISSLAINATASGKGTLSVDYDPNNDGTLGMDVAMVVTTDAMPLVSLAVGSFQIKTSVPAQSACFVKVRIQCIYMHSSMIWAHVSFIDYCNCISEYWDHRYLLEITFMQGRVVGTLNDIGQCKTSWSAAWLLRWMIDGVHSMGAPSSGLYKQPHMLPAYLSTSMQLQCLHHAATIVRNIQLHNFVCVPFPSMHVCPT